MTKIDLKRGRIRRWILSKPVEAIERYNGVRRLTWHIEDTVAEKENTNLEPEPEFTTEEMKEAIKFLRRREWTGLNAEWDIHWGKWRHNRNPQRSNEKYSINK